jgi:hypothetical protein
MLGDITDCCSRHRLSSSKRLQIESMLFRWLRMLPHTLRLTPVSSDGAYGASDDNYNARQLHSHYFTTIAILSRYTTPKECVPHEAVFAASYAAGILETFLARDEIRYLPPPFTIFCLVCSMVLVSLCPFQRLWEAAQADLHILQASLAQLSKRWRSAIGASKALQNAIEKSRTSVTVRPFKTWQWDQASHNRYFEGCASELCRMWAPFQKEVAEQGLTSLRNPTMDAIGGVQIGPFASHELGPPDFFSPEDDAMAFFQYDHINHWLLDDTNFAEF